LLQKALILAWVLFPSWATPSGPARESLVLNWALFFGGADWPRNHCFWPGRLLVKVEASSPSDLAELGEKSTGPVPYQHPPPPPSHDSLRRPAPCVSLCNRCAYVPLPAHNAGADADPPSSPYRRAAGTCLPGGERGDMRESTYNSAFSWY